MAFNLRELTCRCENIPEVDPLGTATSRHNHTSLNFTKYQLLYFIFCFLAGIIKKFKPRFSSIKP